MTEPIKANNKRVVISGGAGFIGSHLCESLVKKGYGVVCVDNFLTGSKDNVEHLMEESNFLLINADVSKKLPDVLTDESIDYIFHLASPASPNASSEISFINLPLETMDVNSIGTRRLLRLARTKKARFLFASTSEVYGDPKVHPQTEDYWGYVNPNGVRSCYDESKRFGEALTMVYVRKFEIDARIVRIFNTYGPRIATRDGRSLVNFVVQALKNKPMTVYGKGKQTRSFCYVTDLVSGLEKLMFKDNMAGEVVNLGNTDEYSILELVKKIQKVTKTKSKIVFEDLPEDDPARRKPDISKARKMLNWSPKVKFSLGLEKTIDYYKKLIEQ
jgi:nucleoside-diphosphate-sugar epimerase